MKEPEVRSWLEQHLDVSRETLEQLSTYEQLLREEATQQNLVSAATLDELWDRHFRDSAQLLLHGIKRPNPCWIDLGSGAGFPGLVVAIISGKPTHLIEMRTRRVTFLQKVVDTLGLANVSIEKRRSESSKAGPPATISARAFAPLDRLFASAVHLADKNTLWLLPRGRNWQKELEALGTSWQGVFDTAPSVTDPESAILIAHGVHRRK